jgi:large subunit ribosomal protein L25
VSDTIVLKAKKREIIGKKLAALREAGDAPAVVHDHGKDSLHISVPQSELRRVYHAAGKHHPINLSIDDKKYTTLIKEVTYKPATSIILHTVFQSVKANETVSAEIPLHFSDEIPAERVNLLVVRALDHVEVEALPKDLVDTIEVDASVLAEVGDKITVADLKAPAGVTIKTDSEQLVAAVEMPKDQIAEADAAAAELAADSGESEEVPSEHGTESEEGTQEGEIRPGGKKEFEDKEQGHGEEKK